MVVHIGAREARNNFSDLLGKVHYGGQTVIIERSGKPVIAMISSETYEHLIAEREMRFQVLEHIRSRLPAVPLNEVEQDVAEALAAVRTYVAGRP
jgi:prevent-host-death family protein